MFTEYFVDDQDVLDIYYLFLCIKFTDVLKSILYGTLFNSGVTEK